VPAAANHIGMTLGLQKGARITQAILEEAQKSASWLQALSAKFSPLLIMVEVLIDGYLSGVTLTPQQMTSMVDLAKNRLTQDQRKYTAVQQEAARGFQSGGTSQTKNDTSRNMPRNVTTYCLFDIFQLVSRSTTATDAVTTPPVSLPVAYNGPDKHTYLVEHHEKLYLKTCHTPILQAER
jgi:hypothetical protein